MSPRKRKPGCNLQNDKSKPNETKTTRDEVDLITTLLSLINSFEPETEGCKVIIPTKYNAENIDQTQEANSESVSNPSGSSVPYPSGCSVSCQTSYTLRSSRLSASCQTGSSVSCQTGSSISCQAESWVFNQGCKVIIPTKYKAKNMELTRFNQSVEEDVSDEELRDAKERKKIRKMFKDNLKPSLITPGFYVSKPSGSSVSNPPGTSVSNPSGSSVSNNPSGSSVFKTSGSSVSKPPGSSVTNPSGSSMPYPSGSSVSNSSGWSPVSNWSGSPVSNPAESSVSNPPRSSVSNPSGSSMSYPSGSSVSNSSGSPVSNPPGSSVSNPSGSSVSKPSGSLVFNPSGSSASNQGRNDDPPICEEEEFSSSDDNLLITYKRKKEATNEWVTIGSGETSIRRNIFTRVNWDSVPLATKSLINAVHPRNRTHCQTGQRLPAFRNKPAKKILDPTKISDIVMEVTKRYNVQESEVRNIIAMHCAKLRKKWLTRDIKRNHVIPQVQIRNIHLNRLRTLKEETDELMRTEDLGQ